MDLLRLLVDFVLHLDRHLAEIIAQFGLWTYAILFLVVFCETGLVATPFLPGDSLLFATGTFCALGSLKIGWMIPLICVAAVLGDTVNYWIGHWVGPKVFTREDVWWLNKKHLQRAQRFYEKHGGKTIILARFIPIIRTFAPFVAGIGAMTYPRFIAFNVVGGCAWVCLFLLSGYYFGNIPVVKENFSLVIIAIILISVVPIFVEWLRGRRATALERAARSQTTG
ncbi:MAG: DedA family protein [Deltaproteobacteria bacterium]|nr:DedA family protein [Deltaproteobacteria bacterium]